MSLNTEGFQLLQRIAENTTPVQTNMISITSTKPEFSVNFPSSVPVKEIALAKLRVYHSWPNIRADAFSGQQPNNELVFAWKNKPDGTPDWKTVSIPTGSYQIEQIDKEFQRRIKSITGKESKIAITVHEPTLSSTIEISTPGYMVDIYNSSIRTVLGWPKNPPQGDAVDLHTDAQSYHEINPQYRDDISIIKDTNLPSRFIFQNKNTMQWYFPYKKTPESSATVTVSLNDITGAFTEINQLYKTTLAQLRETRAPKHVEVLNQLISDMEYINTRIVKTIVGNSDDNKQKFLTEYNITEADLPTFEFPGYNAPELRKSLNDFIGPSTILRHDNGENGRHIAPYNVNITSVIAINLVCDVIEGSYQVNTKQSNQAEQGYILYSFSPTAPPGFLIIESPINPVYMRCHNRFLTSINFRLTDQSNNLIDLQEEELVITLFVRS